MRFVRPLLQLVKLPLKGSLTLQHISCSFELHVISKFAENSCFIPSSGLLMRKILKDTVHGETPLRTGHQFNFGWLFQPRVHLHCNQCNSSRPLISLMLLQGCYGRQCRKLRSQDVKHLLLSPYPQSQLCHHKRQLRCWAVYVHGISMLAVSRLLVFYMFRECSRRNCCIIFPRTEVRFCDIFFQSLETSSKDQYHCGDTGRFLQLLDACINLLVALVCRQLGLPLMLVVFLREASLRSVGDKRDLASKIQAEKTT